MVKCDCSVRVAVLENEIAALRREVGIAHTAHADLHIEADKVREKDAEIMRERLTQMNEFREEGRQVQQTYVRQEVYDTRHGALVDKIAMLEKTSVASDVVTQLDKRVSAAEQLAATAAAKLVGEATGISTSTQWLGAVAIIVTIIVSIAGIIAVR